MSNVNFEQSFDKLKDLIRAMIEAGVNFNSKHWVAKDEESAKKVRNALRACAVNHVLQRKQSKSVEQKPICHSKLCCDPTHLTVVFKNAHKALGMSKSDLEDLMEELDFDEIDEIGEERYLENFNAGLPDYLKISLTTLKSAVNIHRNQKGGI